MVKRLIKLDRSVQVPYYQQIIQSINNCIEKKILIRGDKIPSINEICFEFNVSRDTVMAAFNELKSKGIICSQAGKGYYISSTENNNEENIFLLFDEFNKFRADIYDSLVHQLKGRATVNVFFHHSNLRIFKNLIKENLGKYTSYVIMPGNFDNIGYILGMISPARIYLLDRQKIDSADYPSVYQDFENDMYEALLQCNVLLKKYRSLIYIHSGSKEPRGRIEAYTRFCNDFNLTGRIVRNLSELKPTLYEAYIVSTDFALVELFRYSNEFGCKLGEKIGILSLNNCLLKEFIADGITSVSTDFKEAGKLLAEMILNRNNLKIRVTSKLIIRNSL
jgi:DNA-binding transcriptional regulator YhcF (GntR family)